MKCGNRRRCAAVSPRFAFPGFDLYYFIFPFGAERGKEVSTRKSRQVSLGPSPRPTRSMPLECFSVCSSRSKAATDSRQRMILFSQLMRFSCQCHAREGAASNETCLFWNTVLDMVALFYLYQIAPPAGVESIFCSSTFPVGMQRCISSEFRAQKYRAVAIPPPAAHRPGPARHPRRRRRRQYRLRATPNASITFSAGP